MTEQADRREWDLDLPFDEAFIAAAPRREESGEVRAQRARRVAGDHAVATAWRGATAAPPTALVSRPRPRDWRTVLCLCAAVTVLIGLFVGGWRPAGDRLTARGDGSPELTRPADASDARLAPVPIGPPGTGGYALLQSGVGFDPCTPVHYVMRPDGAPAGAAATLAAAFGRLGRAAGLRFVDDGSTDEGPSGERPLVQRARYGERYAPVLVVWASEAEAPRLVGRTAGYAGPVAVDPDGRGARYVTGLVVLDAAQLANVFTSATEVGVVMHELGHLVGLDHVRFAGDTMSEPAAPYVDYTAGALRGLASQAVRPCV